jgi:Na+/H+ antiporter NhaC
MPQNGAMACLHNAMLIPYLAILAAGGPAAEPDAIRRPPAFKVEVPDIVLTDVPVSFVRITKLNPDGTVDRSFNGQVLISGVRLSVPQDVDNTNRILTADVREDAELPPFRGGVLELKTNLSKRRKVFVVGSEIVVDPQSRQPTRQAILRTQRWFSIVPPLLAILLAVWLRNVIVALFVGIYSGAAILTHGNFFHALVQTLDTYILGEFAPVDAKGAIEWQHLMIIFFTMFLGAMVGVMWQSGGTTALVGSMGRFTKTRNHGQLMTWALGLVVFFDDYANTLLVGSTMRPVTDRLKISREKLAFLVDSTAAPVAGLALVSTWVGIELQYIGDTYADLGLKANVFDVFLATIPYRFYPLHLLAFVCLIAYIGHDYGPMLRAEARALSGRKAIGNDLIADEPADPDHDVIGRRSVARNAYIPLAVLLSAIVVGLWWTGSVQLAADNVKAIAEGIAEKDDTFWNIIGSASSERVLFLSAFIASIVAVACVSLSRSMTVSESIDAWVRGAKGMFYPLMILVLAWSVATICNPEHLNTAGFLVEIFDGKISVVWMPAIAFLLSAIVAFATGSSWSTMGLLMPLLISVTFYLLVDENDADPTHHLMLGTIGAILSGAIFGDHCSPISDTTILSSAASRCNHLAHVGTQLPYAMTVAGVALLLGYLPAGFGYSPIILAPLGLLVLFLLVQFLGRSPEKMADQMRADDEALVDDSVPDMSDLDDFDPAIGDEGSTSPDS